MTGLLEFREKLKLIYSKNEAFILPVVKFLLAFLVLSIINGQMGYMTRLDNMAIVLIAALFCSFMPTGFIIMFAALFSLLHMYALALEAVIVGGVVYLLLFLLFFRFAPKDSLAVVLTPILFALRVPYVMPIAMGLLGTPASAVSVSCGVVVYYLIQTIVTNASTLNTMEAEETTAKLRLLIDGILGNKEMLVVIVAFAITVVVVYLIRRMSIDYSWTVAIIAGVMIDLVILLAGDLIYDTNLNVVSAIIGAVAAIIIGKLIEFFRFCVDYSRTEKVQFEDDEYYYYVKAIPKMTVAAPTKTVKKINSQSRSTSGASRSAQSGRGGQGTGRSVPSGSRSAQAVGGRPGAAGSRPGAAGSRRVTTERTTPVHGGGNYSQQAYQQRNGGRSVTINSGNTTVDETDDYEELF